MRFVEFRTVGRYISNLVTIVCYVILQAMNKNQFIAVLRESEVVLILKLYLRNSTKLVYLDQTLNIFSCFLPSCLG